MSRAKRSRKARMARRKGRVRDKWWAELLANTEARVRADLKEHHLRVPLELARAVDRGTLSDYLRKEYFAARLYDRFARGWLITATPPNSRRAPLVTKRDTRRANRAFARLLRRDRRLREAEARRKVRKRKRILAAGVPAAPRARMLAAVLGAGQMGMAGYALMKVSGELRDIRDRLVGP